MLELSFIICRLCTTRGLNTASVVKVCEMVIAQPTDRFQV